MIQYAALLIFPLVMLFAAISDLMTMKISNLLSIALVVLFCIMAFVVQMPLKDFGWSMLCGFTVLLITFGMFAMGWIGGGDAKLVSATAIWMGWALLLPYLLIASVFGGVLTMLLLMFRRFKLPGFLADREWALRLHKPRGGIPYGVALAASAICYYPSTQIWVSAAAG
jgi:prepilin peptidase CpaA